MKYEMSIHEAVKTMSSREIAQIVESRHDNVKRSMERLQSKGLIRFTPVGETLKQGLTERTVTNYYVNERDSYVVVARLSPEFTARLVDRWQELERNQGLPPVPAGLPDFTKPPVAAMAWAEQYEGREKALAQIEANRPKVEFAESLKAANDSVDITTAAKRLGIGRNKFHAWLRDNHVITLNNLPRQVYVDNGKMETETYVFTKPDGDKLTGQKALFTAKGFIWIEKKVRQHLKAAV